MPSVSVPTVTQTAGGENLYTPAGGAGPGGSVVGTANQITAVTASGVTTLSLASPSPAPTAGAYTNANITVDALGRVTVVANGSSSGGVASIGDGTNPLIGAVTVLSGDGSIVVNSATSPNLDLRVASGTGVIQKVGAVSKPLNALAGGSGGLTNIFTFTTVVGQSYAYQLSLPISTLANPGTPATGANLYTAWSAPASPAGGVGNRGTSQLLSTVITIAVGSGQPDPATGFFTYSESGFFVAGTTSTTLTIRIEATGAAIGANIVAVGSMAVIGGNSPSTDPSYCIITPISVL